jgi:hypothetical protein
MSVLQAPFFINLHSPSLDASATFPQPGNVEPTRDRAYFLGGSDRPCLTAEWTTALDTERMQNNANVVSLDGGAAFSAQNPPITPIEMPADIAALPSVNPIRRCVFWDDGAIRGHVQRQPWGVVSSTSAGALSAGMDAGTTVSSRTAREWGRLLIAQADAWDTEYGAGEVA